MYIFYFRARNCYEGRVFEQSGLIPAENYAEATKMIEKYYSKELVSIEHLEICEDDPIIFLPDDYCQFYLNTAFPVVEFSREVEVNDD